MLGLLLRDKGDLDGAIASFHKALDLDPKWVKAHIRLGEALRDKGDRDGAIASFHKALDLDPKDAEIHNYMGLALLDQGRYAAARESLRCAIKLRPPDAALRRDSQERLQRCDLMLALEKKLPAILTGEASPASPGEAFTLAEMCKHKKRPVAAARLYADAFAADGWHFRVERPRHRFEAACSAVLAAAGQGEDARLLPDKVVCMLRNWALHWLRRDLKAESLIVGYGTFGMKQMVQRKLAHWKRDPDLASVRDPQALDRLGDNERAAWLELWHEVDALAERLGK
jgi:tetratricopeptide (TPR) repeat protein